MATQTEAHSEKETGRIEAFSDGVFAIAITLLCLKSRCRQSTICLCAGVWAVYCLTNGLCTWLF